MKLLRAICECSFHTRKARVGYHFHQWWFPVLNTNTGQLSDLCRSLPKDQVDLIQLGKVCAGELHQPFIASATQELLSQYANQRDSAFNPDIGSTFACPRCRHDTLRVDQVYVTAFCKSDCGHEYQWRDSEQHGCPKCNHRPHRFRADGDAPFAGQSRTESFCPCSSSMDSASPIDAYCPKCGQLPLSYQTNGLSFCAIHYKPFSGSYPVSDTHFFTSYAWRGHESKFPYAKLYEVSGSERTSGTMAFCPDCQEEYERWLAAEGREDRAAQAEDEADHRRD